MLLGGRGRLVPAHVIYESVPCKLTWDAICIGGTITYTEEVSVQLWISHIFNSADSQVEIKLVWEYPGHYNLKDYFKSRHINHKCSGNKKPDRFFTSHLVSPHLVKLQFLIWNEVLCWKTGHLVARASGFVCRHLIPGYLGHDAATHSLVLKNFNTTTFEGKLIWFLFYFKVIRSTCTWPKRFWA